MKEQETEEQNNRVFRNSSLIAGRTKKMALTYIGSTICVAAVSLVDSLVAGISIGADALAAIAASGPLLAIEQILHCLLGVGIDKLMIRAVGKGKREEADRIFGAVLIAVAIVYVLVFGLLLLFERPLLELIMDDRTLIDMIILYTRPLFLSAPFFEVFLCVERAFRVDGRTVFFSLRSIVTNIANILLDVLMVSVWDKGLAGLAWSSVISTTLGYLITLSHFFSPARTVTPDYSVIRSWKELLSYVKEDMKLGDSAAMDEVMDALALSAQTAAISVIGGSGGLAVWAVFKSLRGIVLSMGNGAAASVTTHAGLLNGQKDYDGVRYSVKKGVGISVTASLAMLVIVDFFAEGLAALYHIEPEFRMLCARCLRIGSNVFPPIGFLTVISAYLPTVNRMRETKLLILLQKGLAFAAAAIAYNMSLQGFFRSYVLALWLAALIMLIFTARDRFWFVPERNPEMIDAYSLVLNPDLISAMGADAAEELRTCEFPETFCRRAMQVVEDGAYYIAQMNPDAEVHADVQLRHQDDHVQIMIIDDGEAYNPLPAMAEASWEEPGALEAVLVMGLSVRVHYDRVLGLNTLLLDMVSGVRSDTWSTGEGE